MDERKECHYRENHEPILQVQNMKFSRVNSGNHCLTPQDDFTELLKPNRMQHPI